MDDEILGYLRQARAAAVSEPMKSRELSLVVTKIDEAVLWRQFDLQLKTPADDAANAVGEREHGTKIRHA